MAYKVIAPQREQAYLMPQSPREWLPEGHLALFVIDAVAQMDLSAFYGRHRWDGWGRACYDPALMVPLLLYAYSLGIRSSRQIEKRCEDSVAFRVITGNHQPDHVTIARFRQQHADAKKRRGLAPALGGSSTSSGKAGRQRLLTYNRQMPPREFPPLDRGAFSVARLLEQSDERAYWLAKSPEARLEALELSRQAVYGYDPSSTRLQRLLEITQLERS